jgi:hypothetical protein
MMDTELFVLVSVQGTGKRSIEIPERGAIASAKP